MGREDNHLHEFRVGDRGFGVPDPNGSLMGGPSCINERKVRLADVLNKPRSKAKYIYDFGDSWEHALTIEKVLVPDAFVAYPSVRVGRATVRLKIVAESRVFTTCLNPLQIRPTKVT